MSGVYQTPNPQTRICRYYPAGRTEGPSFTALAIDDDPHERGILTLNVFSGGRMSDLRLNIRHAGDPDLEQEYQRRCGCWDYLPSEKPIRKQNERSTAKAAN